MKCPVCKEISLVMSERQGIEIDYCPECRGVWLDRGELDKIIEKSNNQMNSEYQQQNNKHSSDYKNYSNHTEDKYHKNESYSNQNGRKKESFITNVFDIFGGD